jgi:hypothetical protein
VYEAEAAVAIGRPVAPLRAPPEGEDAALAVCASCGQRRHVCCIPAEERSQVSSAAAADFPHEKQKR